MSQILVTGEAKVRDIQGPVVANSGVITALDGDASQYVRGDGTLADFPTSTGGGSSVSYYLNSSVSQGTIGGVAYRQLGKTPIGGAGTDITISTTGYIASYITDANDPALLEVPAGNFNCEFYFSVNNNTGNPFVYAEVYKYDGTTFTLLGTSVGVPEYINQGTVINPYYFAIPVASSVLSITDRIAIRIYVNVDGRTVTLHTENNHLCQVVTTFSKGLTSLNNLTRQVQFLGTGTSGTDFAISSSTATHTFNLPIASATNTGKLSSTDWSTFNGKQPAGNYVTLDTTQTITAAKTFSLDILVNSLTIGRGAGAIASNTAIGSSALPVNTTGTLNTAIGNFSLLTNTTGYGNTSVGYNALGYNTTGFFNAAIGVNALLSNTTGTYNNALGTASLYNNTTGSNNTAVGQVAGTNNTTGSNNTYIGYASGGGITTGSNNTIIGQFTGTAAMANNIVLADGAGNVRYRYDGTNNNLYGNVNFSSTIGNGTYTYTLPSATGTLALTSQLTGGTVTSVAALTIGTTGTNITSSVANSTTTPVITLNIPNSSATNRGALTAADWITFANKQDALNGTGFVKAIGTDVFFDNTSYLPLTGGTLTGALSGTSATFSSNEGLVLNPSSGNSYQAYKIAGTTYSLVGISGGNNEIISGSALGDLNIRTTNSQKILFSTNNGGSAAMTITSNGRVGIGASSPTEILHLNNPSANSAYIRFQNTGGGGVYIGASSDNMELYANGSERMRITSGGNVGIGTSSPQAKFSIGLPGPITSFPTYSTNDLASIGWNYFALGDELFVRCMDIVSKGAPDGTNGGSMMRFLTTPVTNNSAAIERMRITSGGYTKISNNGTYVGSTSSFHEIRNNSASDSALFISSSSSSYTDSVLVTYTPTTGTAFNLIYSYTANGLQFRVRGDGTIYAQNTTVQSASDVRMKENIINSNDGLNVISALRPVRFDFKEGFGNNKKNQLGFIAQEVEKVFPYIVDVLDEKAEDGSYYKSLGPAGLIPVLVKAIQEQQAQIEELSNKIVALESK
jgi:hypothetical protein